MSKGLLPAKAMSSAQVGAQHAIDVADFCTKI
jgi:hypothetical protein